MEAISHLPTSVLGAKVIGKDDGFKVCEPCRLAKVKRQISRRPITRALKPFARVHFDLIQLMEAYNGDNWLLHLLNNATRMNYASTFANKSGLVPALKHFFSFVETRFGVKIAVMKTDNERTLGKVFYNWAADEGIRVEHSAPYVLY
jgi:hypothetical protein